MNISTFGRPSVLAIAVSCCLLAGASYAESPRLSSIEGTVEIGSGAPPVWRPATDGEALSPGESLRTGRDGRAELVTDIGTVRVFPSSLLRLPASFAERGDRIDLDEGTSVFDINKRKRDTFEVHSPSAVVMVKGTQFTVRAGVDRSTVSVAHGLVGVRGASSNARELLVRPGFTARGGHGLPFALSVTPAGTPAWDAWSKGVEPPLPKPAAAASRRAEARARLKAAVSASVTERVRTLKPAVAVREAKQQRDADDAAPASAEAPSAKPYDAKPPQKAEPRSDVKPRRKPAVDVKPPVSVEPPLDVTPTLNVEPRPAELGSTKLSPTQPEARLTKRQKRRLARAQRLRERRVRMRQSYANAAVHFSGAGKLLDIDSSGGVVHIRDASTAGLLDTLSCANIDALMNGNAQVLSDPVRNLLAQRGVPAAVFGYHLMSFK